MQLKIGEFAAFCNVSVRTLRHYDMMELLKPASVDPETGYRFYEPEQLKTLQTILSYKRIGFSLPEIRELLSPAITHAGLIEILTKKLAENAKRAGACGYYNETIQRILEAYQAFPVPESEEDAALRLSRLACLENDSLQVELGQILWL